MKKALAIAGILALSITPTASLADHLEPKESEIRPGGDLAHTNLSRFRLSGANLSGANLSNANLSNAVLSGADLKSSNLSGANLRFAELYFTNLSGANLSGITATNLQGCPWRLPSGWVCENRTLIQR